MIAHVKRRDYLTAIASQAALAVHFYHPLLHWLAGRVRLEQELAADALAATVSGGRAAYLRTLAELALRRSDGRVAWPARAFLPSRRTFLRRIEMLRDPRLPVDRPAPLLRAATAGCLLVFSLVVAGVRPDAASAQPPQAAGAAVSDRKPKNGNAETADVETTNASSSLVAFIPPTATWVVTVRPIEILADPAVQPFAAELEKGIAESQSPASKALRNAGVTPRTTESLAFGVMPRSDAGRGPEPGAFAFRLTDAADRSVLAKQADETKTTFGGIVYRFGADAFVMLPDDRTVLMTNNEDTLTAMIVSGQLNRKASPWTRGEEHLQGAVLAVLLDTGTVSTEMQRVFQQQGSNTPQAAMMKMAMGTAMPLLQDAKLAGIALTLGEGPGLRGYAACDDESGARRVRETLEALVTIGKNTLRQAKTQIASQPPQQQALAKMFVPIAETLLNSATVKTEGTDVTLTAESGASAAIALGLILPAIQQAREAARRTQSMNNLKQIAIALHNYQDVYGHFPPAVIEENGVKRSWRVELLPFLESFHLFEQYRRNELWDSEANKKVLAQMPAVFRDPSDSSGPTSTSYFVLTDSLPRPLPGDAARNIAMLFSDKPIDLTAGGKGAQFREITDGSSNTLLIVEAKRDVPWTKPEDIPFAPEKIDDLLKNGLGGNHPDGFTAALADGSVRFFGSGIDSKMLKALVTPAGGEVVNWPGVPGNAAGGSPPPVDAVAPPRVTPPRD
ncbi:MAG: DUF1559 domain-containing protein [Planctomycetaceae bacterium]|nr:DUF1559 domain-containing protein [Planctomycetaceae bacterium]